MSLSQQPIYLPLLIGELRELSPQSRIKDNADLAGLSHPQDLLKDLTSLKPEHSSVSLNNSWLTAKKTKEIKDAMVV